MQVALPDFEFDEAFAAALVGSHVIAGITIRDPGTDLALHHEQHHGRVVSAERDSGIVIQHPASGQKYVLPPCTGVFEQAEPGQYRLKSTGEVVVDPDWLATWSVHSPTSPAH